MSKYNAYLADNWKRPEPFAVDWDYELIGDKLRAEFDVWFLEQEKAHGAGKGRTKQLFKGEYVKKFMISKRINLVDDPSNGNLKSVFVLRKDEKKLIDGRAKKNLASRFEFIQRKDKEGKDLEPLGFMKFDLVEGSDEEMEARKVATFQVGGNDISYFEEETNNGVQEQKGEEEKVEEFKCEICGKEFASANALRGHNMSHKK
jgi:hypothetical protein